jgi:hypothetical protein
MKTARKSNAGRKAQGPITGKTSTFSTRITDETRGALEAEAEASGQSISQVAERLLQLGLQTRRERELDDPIRALGFLMEWLADHCRGVTEDKRLCDWNNDPSVFEAFRVSLNKLLHQIRPPGKIDSSLEGPLVGQPPAARGEDAFRNIWSTLVHAEPSSPGDVRSRRQRHSLRPVPSEMVAGISRASYAWSDARRALKIEAKGRDEKRT